MWSKIKEYILTLMAKFCYKQLEREIDKAYEIQIAEIVAFIEERHAAGVVINFLAHEDFYKDKFALHSDPLPEPSHLTVVEDEQD